MLGRKSYSQEELSSCRAAIGAELEANRRVEAAVGNDALAGFEGPFFTNMVLGLDRWFVHRVRAVSGKDGNPLNEVELIVDSVMTSGGVLCGNNVIRYVPGESVLGLGSATGSASHGSSSSACRRRSWPRSSAGSFG